MGKNSQGNIKGLPKDLLEILACPDDKSPVVLLKSGKVKEQLKCRKCKRVFEIRDGIPIMLPKDEK